MDEARAHVAQLRESNDRLDTQLAEVRMPASLLIRLASHCDDVQVTLDILHVMDSTVGRYDVDSFLDYLVDQVSLRPASCP